LAIAGKKIFRRCAISRRFRSRSLAAGVSESHTKALADVLKKGFNALVSCRKFWLFFIHKKNHTTKNSGTWSEIEKIGIFISLQINGL
jgi:hypothetical protein